MEEVRISRQRSNRGPQFILRRASQNSSPIHDIKSLPVTTRSILLASNCIGSSAFSYFSYAEICLVSLASHRA